MNDSVKSEVPLQEPLTKETQTEATITSTVSNAPKKLAVVPNWRKVLKTWSFWCYVSSVLLTFIEQILPVMGLLEPTMTVQTYGLIMFGLNASGILFRFIKQRKLWTYDPVTGDVVIGDTPQEGPPNV